MKLVIYTCLFGDKESIGNPLARLMQYETDLELDFICFTDNRQLTSDIWQFIYLEDHLSGERLSRKPKTMPHLYLQQYEYSLYIDNIVEFKRLPSSSDLVTDREYLFKLFKHTRTNLQQEADAIVSLGYDEPNMIVEQLAHYQKQFPLESITPLSTCTVIFRSHKHPKIIKFGQTWWEQFLTYSKRDQMSFDFCLKYLNYQVEYFDKPKNENDLIYKTDNIRGRVRASFDTTKYAWIHRDEPDAVSNPKQHFLNANKEHDLDYTRKIDILGYLCYKNQSSLANYISPRRNVSGIINDMLIRRTTTPHILFASIENNHKLAYSSQEHNAAANTIHQWLASNSKNAQSKVITISHQLLRQKFKLNDSNAVFSKYILLNIDNENITYVINALVNLNKDGFVILLLSIEALALNKLIELKVFLEQTYNMRCNLSIHASYHDDSNNAINNSVIALSCEKQS